MCTVVGPNKASAEGEEKKQEKKQLSIERCLAATQAMMEWRGQFASAKHGADFVP